jgi:glycosyltransferase involved in cell wall biosynthesis
MKRTVILIPCWGRSDVVQACYDSLQALPCRRVWIVSDDDPQREQILDIINRSKKDIVLEYTNQPLGRKLNAGITYMIESMRGWDYLMNWGSDDIVDPALIEVYQPYIDKGVKYFGINSCYMYDTVTNEAIFCMNYNAGMPVGAGRMIHRTVIKLIYEANEYLYSNRARSGLDGDSHKRIVAIAEVEPVVINSSIHPYVVDLKSKGNINEYYKFSGFPTVKREIITSKHHKILKRYEK